MPDTVLIAAPDRLRVLVERSDLRAALTYPDTDALAAFELIVQQRPKKVALERLFADSPRGAALIERIRTDPALASCEVQIVTDASSEAADVVPDRVTASSPDSPAPLDPHGTRRAPRFAMAEGLAVTLDGNPVALIDLSVDGAQVIAKSTLRPNQRVRLTLRQAAPPIRLSASVQWANYEMSREGACYRAGLKFMEPDVAALERFIAGHRRPETPGT